MHTYIKHMIIKIIVLRVVGSRMERGLWCTVQFSLVPDEAKRIFNKYNQICIFFSIHFKINLILGIHKFNMNV